MQSTYIDFSKEIEILEQKALLLDQINILDEAAIADKLKNWSGDKIKKFVESNYKKIENKEKELRRTLANNNIDAGRIEKEIRLLEPEIKKDMQNIQDKNKFRKIIEKIWNKINAFSLFGKEGDPAKIIPALSMFIFISVMKVLAFTVVWGFLGEGVIFPIKLILVFLVMPIISEIGKYLSIKTGTYEKFHVYLNITEFLVMTGFYVFLTNVGLLPLLIFRGLQFVTGIGTGEMIKKLESEKGAGASATGLAAFIQLVRVFIEICFVSMWTGDPFNTNADYTKFWKTS